MSFELDIEMVHLTLACRSCKTVVEYDIPIEPLQRYVHGDKLVQVAFPEADVNMREFIMQAAPNRPFPYYLCPSCFDELSEDDEEESEKEDE